MRKRVTPTLVVLVAALGLVTSGCAGAEQAAGTVPDSASLAPADAVAYATVVTDESSDQWQQAESLIDRIPGARDQLSSLTAKLGEEGLTWKDDVAPALGPEVVVVVTKDLKTVALTQPDDESRLGSLLAKSDDPPAHATVEGWTALAETQADLDAYRTALGNGALSGDDDLEAGFAALPAEALARVWVDVADLTPGLAQQLGQAEKDVDLGFDWISAAVAAEEHGVKLAVGVRTPGGNGTEYEPKLFERVPADAVAALSFGGTQVAVDRIESRIPLGEIADQIEGITGVSVGGILDAFSGEGVLYVRPGDSAPEVTLVLSPPDADTTWETVDHLAHTVAREAGATVRTETEHGREVHLVDAQGVTVRYARLDGDTVIVTTGTAGIDDFTGDGDKLVSSDAYRRAADDVGLDDRTGGFVYVDIDGLVPVLESVVGEPLPADERAAVQKLDAFILEASRNTDGNTLSGFLRLND